MNHTRWRLAREAEMHHGNTESPTVIAEREQIRLAMMLGQLVYDRRTALGLSEDDLAARLGMTADEVEHIEVGGVLPVTSDLLLKIAAALDVAVDVHLAPTGSEVSFETDAA
ncbi:helix-turn-helix domain-containing protein [Streptomyces mobaraensis]|uniref:Helix-turn-helix transcriptional regulator n=1 Tax=Streptomyces mobaraensis TaxID=35621 RepID=A0A5N5WDJ1_STRMB|nr:helix-turn-helix transcriptional regulator [Streptomyces mobaraensis]KAB7850000.1 helix-turn-helix transcriptional regulator [Streptomyces mobaraensis]